MHSSILGSYCAAPLGLTNVRLFGYGLEANKDNQIIFGRYNNPDSDFEMLWGIGKKGDQRDNGMGMSWDGNFYIKGNVYVGEVAKGKGQVLAKESDVRGIRQWVDSIMPPIEGVSIAGEVYHKEKNKIDIVAAFNREVTSPTIDIYTINDKGVQTLRR